jgi:precorrin-6B methylase 2
MEDPVPSLSVPCVLGGTPTEQQRLIVQATELEVSARSLLDRISIEPGARVADVGCGPIGILNLLSERVGPEGAVMGVEREPRFVEMARTEVSQRGLLNVEVIDADALKTGLEKNSCDVVHERLVLINLPTATQSAILAEMFSLLRPGGTIVLQEYDASSYACYPDHPSWNALLGIFNDTFHAAGGNEYIGRSLASRLRSAGAEKVEIRVHAGCPKVGEYQRTHLLSLIGSMRDRVLAAGHIGEVELRAHMDALSNHLSDPATTVIDKLMVQAWGQKPSSRAEAE